MTNSPHAFDVTILGTESFGAGGIENPIGAPRNRPITPGCAPDAIRKGTRVDTRVLERTPEDKEFRRTPHQSPHRSAPGYPAAFVPTTPPTSSAGRQSIRITCPDSNIQEPQEFAGDLLQRRDNSSPLDRLSMLLSRDTCLAINDGGEELLANDAMECADELDGIEECVGEWVWPAGFVASLIRSYPKTC